MLRNGQRQMSRAYCVGSCLRRNDGWGARGLEGGDGLAGWGGAALFAEAFFAGDGFGATALGAVGLGAVVS